MLVITDVCIFYFIIAQQVMECEFCDRKFKYRKSFNHHMQTEHGMSDDSDVPLSSFVPKLEVTIEEEEVGKFQYLNGIEAFEILFSLITVPEAVESEGKLVPVEIPTKKVNLHNCHVCDAQFARANHLTRHMTLHRAVLIHKCDRCDKAFASQDFLEKHTQQDHIDRAYHCSICEKTFTRGEHLIRHLKIHLNASEKEENLKCSICENDFSR